MSLNHTSRDIRYDEYTRTLSFSLFDERDAAAVDVRVRALNTAPLSVRHGDGSVKFYAIERFLMEGSRACVVFTAEAVELLGSATLMRRIIASVDTSTYRERPKK